MPPTVTAIPTQALDVEELTVLLGILRRAQGRNGETPYERQASARIRAWALAEIRQALDRQERR